jgi:hypothetical protein
MKKPIVVLVIAILVKDVTVLPVVGVPLDMLNIDL